MMFRNTSPVNLTNNDNSSAASSPRMRRSNSRGFDQMKALAPGYVPGDDDVLVGRGKKCLVHTGNLRFKQIVATKLSAYLAAECRVDKTAILMEVIAQVRINSPNGGFVKQNPKTGQYFEVGDFLAKEKTAQAFRDALHEYYSSSNPSKKKRRIQSTISGEKKPAVGSSSNKRSPLMTTEEEEEEDDSEVTFVGTSQSSGPTPQPSLVSAMHTQFTRQSSLPTQFTMTPTSLRKAKSAPSSPVRETFVDVTQRSHTPPPSFARFVSAEPMFADADAPLPLTMGEEIGSLDYHNNNNMMMMESSPMKRKSSVILGDTLAVLSSALDETGFISDSHSALLNNNNSSNHNMNMAGENSNNDMSISSDNINEDPFEPIPLSSLYQNMGFSDLA